MAQVSRFERRHLGRTLDTPLVTSPLPPPPETVPFVPRPRVWTVVVAYGAAVIGLIAASAAVVFVAFLARAAPGSLKDPALAGAAFKAALSSPGVQIGSVAATAAVLIAVALAAAGLSPEPAGRRLALGPSRLGLAAVAVAVLGALALSSTFDAGFGALGIEQTGSIAELARLLAGMPPGPLAVMVLCGGVAAPFAEELFFRGYVQTRLCARWGAWPGIVVTAALFGLVHMDRFHSPSAFLIGIYLGWLTHRTASIRAAVAAHAANNSMWLLATSAGLGAALPRGAHAMLLAVYVAVTTVAVVWLRRRLASSSPSRSPTAVAV